MKRVFRKTMSCVVETGFPLPPRNVRRTQYPFAKLTDVGMRFRIKTHGRLAYRKLRHAAWEYGHRRGLKFACRDLGREGLACWRIQ